MVTVREVLDCLEDFAPGYMAMDFDNVGLLAGFPEQKLTRVLCALDVTDGVIEEAETLGAELIAAHHPLIFHPLKSLRADDAVGRKLIRLVRGGRSAICMHTNLDSAAGGVNDALAEALGLRVLGLLSSHGRHPNGEPYGIGRVCELPEAMPVEAFLARVKGRLCAAGLRWVPGKSRRVSRVAVCGGAGGGEIADALAAGCDAYVTADLKYDQLLSAAEAGLTLIDADHFCTENVVVPKLKEVISTRFPELEVLISKTHAQTARFY